MAVAGRGNLTRDFHVGWLAPGRPQPPIREDRMITVTVNGVQHRLDIEPETPLLWVVRDELGLTGTKFGCGIAQCGCCTVHVDGEAVRSCSLAIGDVDGKSVVTIEGLSPDSTHPVQLAWLAGDVPQCGYCQSGQIMAAAAFLKQNPQPSDADIDAGITNICRCGTYPRIRAAIHHAAALIKS
jgi:isoquinoline 1-oxidoreductase alpha subunit